MDEDDQMGAEAHQQELERRQAEDEAMRKGRDLLKQFRIDIHNFELESEQFWTRITQLTQEQSRDRFK